MPEQFVPFHTGVAALTLIHHVRALVQLVSAEQDLVVGEPLGTAGVDAAEADLLKHHLLELAQVPQALDLVVALTLAGCVEVFRLVAFLPFFLARLAEITFADRTLLSLDDDFGAVRTRQRLDDIVLKHRAAALEQSLRFDSVAEVER